MNSSKDLHHLDCWGLIDRDFKDEKEIEQLRKDGIYTIGVAEVENLFIVEAVLECVNQSMSNTNKTSIDDVKKELLDRYLRLRNSQINKALASELKYQLSIIDLNEAENIDFIELILDNFSSSVISVIKERISSKYNKNVNYTEMLRIYNDKNLISSVGHHFGLNNKSYQDFVLRKFGDLDQRVTYINAVKKYLPTEINI